jgi:large subunit GTPase 1
VIERSDLVVQIVDARNPLLFRSEDLELYVKEVDPKKANLLLVNKADMMTTEQREAWADYFDNAGINFKFFSAELALEMNEARVAEEDSSEYDSSTAGEELEDATQPEEQAGQPEQKTEVSASASASPLNSERTRILTTDELEALFLQNSPTIERNDDGEYRKTQIGLVGYPNVGKSSTINALIGAKKVSVSATPGKTKHFQTIHLSDRVILCDCPGLVFPNFATTKAELVVNGVLPIDQLREFTGPAGLVAQRIPQAFLEALYGMKIRIRPIEEGGTGIPTASELLRAYASARGFSTQGQGQPDESRAARYVLKDYVKGKLLYCHPPPSDNPIDPAHFNQALYDDEHLPSRHRGQLIQVDDISLTSEMGEISQPSEPAGRVTKSSQLDSNFFGGGSGDAGHLRMPFQYQYSEQGQAAPRKQITGRKQRELIALEKNISPEEVRLNSKKHFKANKRKGKAKSNASTEFD